MNSHSHLFVGQWMNTLIIHWSPYYYRLCFISTFYFYLILQLSPRGIRMPRGCGLLEEMLWYAIILAERKPYSLYVLLLNDLSRAFLQTGTRFAGWPDGYWILLILPARNAWRLKCTMLNSVMSHVEMTPSIFLSHYSKFISFPSFFLFCVNTNKLIIKK